MALFRWKKYYVSSHTVKRLTAVKTEENSFLICFALLCKLRYFKCLFTILFFLVIIYFLYTVNLGGEYHAVFVVNRTNSTSSAWTQIDCKSHPSACYNESNAVKLISKDRHCPPIPPNLEGHVEVKLTNIPSIEEQERDAANLVEGGRFVTKECKAKYNVAILIPFRSRESHLKVFLYNIHPFLQKQQINYTIFIIEQFGKMRFNRASLLNVGYLEALQIQTFDCFVFHDIDLLPEDDRNLYTCPLQPRHMSVAINTLSYKLPYHDIFGGVSALTTEQFKTVNGFSNKFWGWGAEDDDMSNRLKLHNFYIARYPANIARYYMMVHKKSKPNPRRYKVLKDGHKNSAKDGLNNVKYKVMNIEYRKLYTWIQVKLLVS